ncbi:hypothetical protein Scani_15770 [Streptomyces caniferus]|uniref:Uncharacterized protein n=1 Tax=Streptomyces caniferus TaxID=285557 RepID=A0A640S2G8_9ACTN|nr:hypothetical protein Scani_15770 [Streptomyces caniferus]
MDLVELPTQGCGLPAFTGATHELAATGLFIAIGRGQRTELLNSHLELDAEGDPKVDAPSTAPTSPAWTADSSTSARPSLPTRPDGQVCAPRWSAAGGQARGARIPVV